MAKNLGVGVILRRGASNMPAADLKWIMEREDEAEKIIKEIDARRGVYHDAERKATAAIKKLDATKTGLAERETKLAVDLAALAADSKTAEVTIDADMAALGRRTREVMDKEKAGIERDAELDLREKGIETTGLTQENEHRAREEVVDARETAAEEREGELHTLAGDLDARLTRLNTAATMVRQAVAPLGR